MAQQPSDIQATSVPSTTIIQVPGQIVMYNVSEQELETLFSGFTSLRATFLGVAAGALITVLAVVLSVELSDRKFAVFIALLFVSGGFTLFFGAGMVQDIREHGKRLQRIRQRRTSSRGPDFSD